jgi:CRISPR-associated protein (TIGR02584 family)
MTDGAHLLALVGLAPAVASETYWAMLQRGEEISNITLVTTGRGAMKVRESLLGEKGALARIAATLARHGPHPKIHVHLLSDSGSPVEDVVSREDHLAVQVALDCLVRRLTAPDAPTLHASLAGGRKTMAAALALAMSFHARPEDRLSHVLVAPPYADDPDFLFPPPDDPLAADAITLIDAPFVRLRPLLPGPLRERPIAELIGAAQAQVEVAAPALLDLCERTLTCGGKIIVLPPLQAATLAVLARHPEGFYAFDLPRKDLADAWRATGATRAAAEDLGRRLAEAGADAWLREMISRIQSRLRAELPLEWAARLAVLRVGSRPRTRYCLAPRTRLVKNFEE